MALKVVCLSILYSQIVIFEAVFESIIYFQIGTATA